VLGLTIIISLRLFCPHYKSSDLLLFLFKLFNLASRESTEVNSAEDYSFISVSIDIICEAVGLALTVEELIVTSLVLSSSLGDCGIIW